MADDSAFDKVEKAGKKLADKLFGAPKKAAEKINAAPAKVDAEVKRQVDDEPTKDDSKGTDKGELGKKWEDTFHF